ILVSPPTAKPRLEEQSCPHHQNWTEGQEETLRCRARGNPPPELECVRGDGQPFPPEVPRPVTRAHAGTYLCWATNPLGTAQRRVTVTVHCEQPGGGLEGLEVLEGLGLEGSW
ncbi:ICAM1 protein, partial [Brachypteracias leptosomus]|nr:ICAM1 protein [Brachypteracias leptosomus]